jgi:SNF2 family DNA or RNA helicase
VDKPWGAVIIDESHSIGSHNSNQTLAAITLGKLARFRYAMTGTPVHGGGGQEDFSKLYGQLQFLMKGNAFEHWTAFCREYVTGYDNWRQPKSYNVGKCRKLLQEHGIVCRLEDCIDMPGKIEQDVPCKLVEKTVYEDIMNGELDKYDLDIEVAGGQYLKMLQICSGSMKLDDTRTLKLKTSKDGALGDILNGTDDAVVVFCTYRASVDRCVEIGKKAGRKVVSLDGRSKKETWKTFQNGKADMIVCQYQAGSAGLNLQRSHTMVF